jgi:hypothetical protein
MQASQKSVQEALDLIGKGKHLTNLGDFVLARQELAKVARLLRQPSVRGPPHSIWGQMWAYFRYQSGMVALRQFTTRNFGFRGDLQPEGPRAPLFADRIDDAIEAFQDAEWHYAQHFGDPNCSQSRDSSSSCKVLQQVVFDACEQAWKASQEVVPGPIKRTQLLKARVRLNKELCAKKEKPKHVCVLYIRVTPVSTETKDE